MIKRFCDRCETVMDDSEPVSHIDGCCIVKSRSGCPDANNPWKVLDLCPDCLKSFSRWMKDIGARTASSSASSAALEREMWNDPKENQ